MKNSFDDLLRSEPQILNTGSTLPDDIVLKQIGNEYTKIRMVLPKEAGVDLKTWIRENTAFVNSLFKKDRILLFRGFVPFNNKQDFSETVKATSESKSLNYAEPSTPRTKVHDDIYTSTEYPKEHIIPQHNEHSYSDFWPGKLFFYCEKPAGSGGATPVCNSSEVYKLIPPAIVHQFESKGGVMYVRNFTDEMDIRWADFFGTTSREEVEAYCKTKKMQYTWLEDNKLRISQVSQATITDKVFNRKIWFNQAHLFHASNLNPDVAEYLIDTYGKENLPRNTFFGDGTEIPVADLDQVRLAYEKVMFRFNWEKGDLLVIDNVNYTHGRDTYTGDRSLLVAMSEEDGITSYQDAGITFVEREEKPQPEPAGIVNNSRRNTAAHFFLKDAATADNKELLKYKLAVSCRLLRLLDLDEGSISGHISVKVPGSENLFWVNPFGVLFDEVTPENLILVNEDGIVLEGDHPINVAGFCIHSSIHRSNRNINCIVHTHSPWGTLFSAIEDAKVLPIDQNCCMFYDNHILYRDFDGPVNNLESAGKLAKALRGNDVAILANHGTITCGDDIESAVMYTVCLERALRLNVQARQLNQQIRLIDPEIAAAAREWIANPIGFKIEFDALTRRVEREFPEIRRFLPHL